MGELPPRGCARARCRARQRLLSGADAATGANMKFGRPVRCVASHQGAVLARDAPSSSRCCGARVCSGAAVAPAGRSRSFVRRWPGHRECVEPVLPGSKHVPPCSPICCEKPCNSIRPSGLAHTHNTGHTSKASAGAARACPCTVQARVTRAPWRATSNRQIQHSVRPQRLGPPHGHHINGGGDVKRHACARHMPELQEAQPQQLPRRQRQTG